MSLSAQTSGPIVGAAPSAAPTPFVDTTSRGPIRAEIFGLERLELNAQQLAEACAPEPSRRSSSPLLERFAENRRVLVQAHRRIVAEAGHHEPPGIVAEWLTDNFHIIEEVLREVRQDFPPGYDQELTKVSTPPLHGYPRIYALAVALVAHSDSELDEGRIEHYLAAFQNVAPLDIGELWALPTMLRLVLIENLRRLTEEMLWAWDEQRRAERWAADLISAAEARDAKNRPAHLPPMPEPSDPFLARLLQRLRDRGPSIDAELARLEDPRGGSGSDVNEVLRREQSRQAANQVSMGNAIVSLRVLSAIDWNAFVERNCRVEALLRDDPAGMYARQDFATRDRYRRAVERLARQSSVGEQEVAQLALEAARRAGPASPARGHVGYYLVGPGEADLKRRIQYRPLLRERLLDGALARPCATYFGGIALVLTALLALGAAPGVAGAWGLILVVAALLVPASELAVGLVNHVLTLIVPPRSLPKLDFRGGIPADCATMVVMPSLLARPESAAVLLERLEIHYLANPDPQLRFALLTDFTDAPEQEMPDDEGLLRGALARVAALNESYRGDGPDKFFLFHRRRQWNPAQGCWMGWERKRGKLSEFNRLLRGDRQTSYAVLSGDPAELPHIRFVITLDADTQMPRDTAGRLVGAMAHPLNLPRFDPALGRVVEGHAVLQPRVSFHLSAATHSRFAALLASSGGIDPYSTAASDAYMDLFGIGSFTGKGIYEVDAFEAATGHTFPENSILSHDLIEGNYARCGLLSDTELFDDFPARYHAYARREHRWVRGDWQLLPWLARRVPTPDGPRDNPLPTLERWKLFDNLRRSLVPPALVLLLALGWTVLPGSPWHWTLLALAVPALPLIQQLIGTTVGCARARSLAGLKSCRDTVPAAAAQALLTTAFLANQARVLLDAITRTLLRVFISRRHLLEWETAATTERRLGHGLEHFARTMWPSPALAVVLAGFVVWLRPEALAAAGPVLISWLLAPLVAYWVSQPRPAEDVPLTDGEQRELRRIARRTWLFFETYVGDDDHWLPPDNYQEAPEARVAHRTSPTNQGLLLLSTLAAHDLGYLGLRALADRLEKTFATFDQMERHSGHFYNWYDTRTLRPLPPRYLSTVDSGNLLGCLVTLKRGLEEKAGTRFDDPSVAAGLADALGLAAEPFHMLAPPPAGQSKSLHDALGNDLRRLEDVLAERTEGIDRWDDWLGRVQWATVGLIGRVRAYAAASGQHIDSLESWMRRLSARVQEARADLATLAPWLPPLRDWEALPGPAWTAPEAETRWKSVRSRLVNPTSLATLVGEADSLRQELAELEPWSTAPDALKATAEALRPTVAAELLDRLRRLAQRAEAYARAMDFRTLYRDERHLYAIGCNVEQGRLDAACYDLLASESCLTSFLTVARGDAPRRHWFQLGRPFIRAAGRPGLVSWGGTMFEYLMPRLMLRALPGTLVDEAGRTAVARQVEYGRQRGVPWGISESALSAQYPDGDYQYQSFGVPGLGLKRGLERDLVVAPYATALAAMVAPREALANFRRLVAEGALGPYGFHEAIDYTPERVGEGRRSVVVRSYMAHHQGMSLVALANALLDDPMPRRFHAQPMVRAVELLLQERIPRDAPVVALAEAEPASQAGREAEPIKSRRITSPATPTPRTHLLSNGRYHVMLTNSGAGWSTCRGLDVTRWREDPTRDCWGSFCYLRDIDRGLVWSAGHQPVGRSAEEYAVTFAPDKASFRSLHDGIVTLLEVAVSTEQLAEVRRVTLTNQGPDPRTIEVTSYAEIVVNSRGADLAHPAFSKLFLETEWIAGPDALLCRRRPRGPDQKPVWAVHVMSVDGPVEGDVQFETDRARFLGRGRTPANPEALDPDAVLSGATGPVLDPIFSLRRRVRLEPGGSVVVAFATAVADSRDEALGLADQYRSPRAAARTFDLAWAQSRVEHRARRSSAEESFLYQRLAAHAIFAGSALRADPAAILANRQAQPMLWRYGISGDRPIILARIADAAEMPLARQLLEAHAYLRPRGLDADLVLLGEEMSGYLEEQNRQLLEAVRAAGLLDVLDQPGGVFVRKTSQMPPDDQLQLSAIARLVFDGSRGSLAGQLDRVERVPPRPEALVPTRPPGDWTVEPVTLPEGLVFANGLGGFTPDGREYCILVAPPAGHDVRRNGTPDDGARARPRPVLPPAPWVNVVANPHAGFVVSETGAGFTWTVNSQLNRLTPWSNDPVSDPPGEVVYVRDEETGEFWSPAPLPVASEAPTLVRHGQGATAFERNVGGLRLELIMFVPPDDPLKLIRLRVRNSSDRPRRLSTTFYAEWVLGTTRDSAAMHVTTAVDPETGALLAHNTFRSDFSERVAFAAAVPGATSVTGDRTEFLGRLGSVANPAALARRALSGRVGAALDPCAALQVPFDLRPDEVREIVFVLGETDRLAEARELASRYRTPGAVDDALAAVRARWDQVLGAVQVRTPSPAMDLLLNRWLLYQVLGCRVWGRSAFYQSGGAYGFRDQLQDVMALGHAAPDEARGQILRAAARQFVEGDVQHWWHPPTGRGVRTHCSDDFLWLPFVVAHYVTATGDHSLLDERAAYLCAPVLKSGQDDSYGLPEVSREQETIYDHCLRAIAHATARGPHGLPLMGTGDWNDGMNRVGAEGRGESVWVGWFLLTTLRRFAEIAEGRGDRERASNFREKAEALGKAIESQAWDGAWYRRAFFDDGTPLGSAANDECRIDSIAQSWAVISGAGDPDRARRALASVVEHLVRPEDGLILLFEPPFDAGVLEPGYIKGYVPGIRENGGQYTHAAAWVVQAAAISRQGGLAFDLFCLLNPIHRASAESLSRYKVEPYVVAADVYGRPPHVGRGGWTWYTGSAAWLYRAGLDSILGLRRDGQRLIVEPCIPSNWPGFEIVVRHGASSYRITVENPSGVEHGVVEVRLDGQPCSDRGIRLADDGHAHEVLILMGVRSDEAPSETDCT